MPSKSKSSSKATARQDEDVVEQEVTVTAAQTDEQLAADVDAILDEIDEVLETNAEEFVRSYVQKGGQ